MGINERYRAAILLAAQRTGLDPAGIAAIINAEAAPITNKTVKATMVDQAFHAAYPGRDWAKRPLNHKDAADAPLIKEWKALHAGTAWDKDSYNDLSHAGGMTQFLPKTWRGEAKRSSTYLGQFARANGYLDGKGEVILSKDSALLDLRFDPVFSIVAAAEYDQYTFEQVRDYSIQDSTEVDKLFFASHPERDFSKSQLDPKKDAGLIQEWRQLSNARPRQSLIPSSLSDDQKARYLYLCHHEGHDGAIQFLCGSLTDSWAAYLLKTNVPDTAARAVLMEKHGRASVAYTKWLWNYIDQHIQPSGFRA